MAVNVLVSLDCDMSVLGTTQLAEPGTPDLLVTVMIYFGACSTHHYVLHEYASKF